MEKHDTPSTTKALKAFQSAWLECMTDYEQQRINSEGCLQAALYHHLICQLRNPTESEDHHEFNVYSEVRVKLSETALTESEKKKVIIDLVICKGLDIVVAIEVKYAPRKSPKADSVRKDLTSLSHITNRRNKTHRCSIVFERHQRKINENGEVGINSERKLIFAAFCAADAKELLEDSFWSEKHRPTSGYWKDRTAKPVNLGIALGLANSDGNAKAVFCGPAFNRLADPG